MIDTVETEQMVCRVAEALAREQWDSRMDGVTFEDLRSESREPLTDRERRNAVAAVTVFADWLTEKRDYARAQVEQYAELDPGLSDWWNTRAVYAQSLIERLPQPHRRRWSDPAPETSH